MAPRGLKAFLKKSAPAKLVGTGKFKGFALVRQGKKTSTKLKGLTKALAKRVWSSGALPAIAKRADPKPGGHWGGKRGGIKRGAKVDAQLSRLINAGPAALKKITHVYNLTKMVLAGLATRGLEPVMAQRTVASQAHRVGTAADFVCVDKKANRLVLVELKCGHDHGITAPTVNGQGKACTMKAPLSKAADCVLHRHLMQLCVTRELFVREASTIDKLGDLGLDKEGCERFGYECDSIYSRDAATGMARQTTEDGLKEVMAEATVNSASVYNWLGGCGSWVSQAYSPLPFFRTGNGKCFSSGLNTNDPPDYG